MKRVRFLAAAIGLAAAARPVAAQAPALVPLHIGATPADDFTPVIYAQKAGLFTRAGLDVRIEKMAGGAAVAAAVLSGTFDIGKSSIPTLLDAHEKGVPFTLIAPAAIYDTKAPYGGFIVAKDATIRTGKDFENQNVAVAALGDIGNLALQAWVEQHGGDAGTIKFLEIPLAAGLPAVNQNRVIAAEIGYPSLATALASGTVRLVPIFDGIAPSFMVTAWFTTKDFTARHPDAIRAFARVCAAAAAYTNSHHDETASMMADFTGLALPLIQRMTRTVSGTTLEPTLIQPVIDAAVKYKMLKRAFPAREVIDPVVAAV